MAQLSSKIAEAFCGGAGGHKGNAKLRGYSVSSNSPLDPLTGPGTEARTPPPQRGADERAGVPRPDTRAVLREAVTPLALEGAAQLPRMAAGVGGFNIDPRLPREGKVRDPIALEPQLGARRLLISEPLVASERPKGASARFGKYSLALCAGVAIAALTALYLADDPRQFRDFKTMVPFSPEAIGEKPRLLVEAQNGLPNEPLPVGITVAGAFDGATITIEGLPDGADLSLGSRSDHSSWTLAATKLEQTFVGAPTDFVGIMEPTATLRSASGKLLDRQALRFEWRASNGAPVTSPVDLKNETASAGSAAAAPSTALSPPSFPPAPALALPPKAAPPDIVGQGSGSEAVVLKRGARSKGPHRKRTSPLEHADPRPTVSIFNLFSWDYIMGVRPTRGQAQSPGKSQARPKGRRSKSKPTKVGN